MVYLYTELLLIVLCSLVVLSYLFSIIGQSLRVPSVLLLLFAGIGFRYIANFYELEIVIPQKLVEILGVVGLIMIVLEAGLDLKLSRDKIKLIRDSFLSAIVLLVMSSMLITAILQYWLNESFLNCLVYAIPLSIISSAIVIPSLHQLSPSKKEFLVYEASFSDILGIIAFNYFIADETLTLKSTAIFSGNMLLSVFLSVIISMLLIYIMTKTKLSIKFFLIFSLLILLYATGKILHLPSLIIILVFGLMIKNWDLFSRFKQFHFSPIKEVEPIYDLMHSITAETSFLVRTFFFIFFGFSINIDLLMYNEVLLIGGLIVIILFSIRLLYLRFFVHTNVIPEVFFMPRGLITIVLFYKIPSHLKLHTFNDGILFFVILTTGIIMMLGMIFYKKDNKAVLEEAQFSERQDIL